MLEKFVAYVPSIVGILAVSSIVLVRNSNNKINRLFFFLNLTVSIWLTLLLFADTTGSNFRALVLVRSAVAITNIIAATFVIFSYNFPSERKLSARKLTLIWGPMIFLFFASFTPSMVESVSITESGAQLVSSTSLYSAYSLISLIYFISGAIILLRNKKKAGIAQKQQINLVLLGVMIGFFVNLITGYIFTLIGVQGKGNLIGSFSLLAFAVLTSYAIIKHRLFDIRTFVVRSLAYILAISVTALIYVLPAVIVTSYFVNAPLKASTFLLLSAMTLVAAVFFQPLQTRFNKLTNRIFFRDYYDPQEVLDKISSFLVGTVDVRKIEHEVSNILIDSIKPSSINYLLLGEDQLKDKDLLERLLKSHTDIAVFDELKQHSQTALYNAMKERNLAIAARLKTSHKDLGFIVLGFKQSGGIYSEGDKKLLGIVADEIAVGLQNALRFEEIQRFNITLQDKVDDATRELRHVNTRLKELDKTKDEFISMASHQLRTPLTTIKGYLSMVLEGDVGPVTKDERKMIQQAFDSSERMVFLIADLLNISRLQSGKFVIDNKPTDLAKMVEAEVAQLQDTAVNHKLTLSYKKPDSFPMLNLDETKIRQVIMNFLDNAIFYTPAGGSITVLAEATDKEINYTVTDTGLGVPVAEQHHLFAKFYRAGNARKMRPDGTGLGLFMAKKVIAAQGGAIIFKSTEGKGSTFGFSFPRSTVEIKT